MCCVEAGLMNDNHNYLGQYNRGIQNTKYTKFNLVYFVWRIEVYFLGAIHDTQYTIHKKLKCVWLVAIALTASCRIARCDSAIGETIGLNTRSWQHEMRV